MSFLNSGQVCIAVKRIYVQENIYDQFLAAFVDRVKTLQLGDGFEDGVFVGPLQNKQQYEIAQRFLSDIQSQNLKVALGGSVVSNRPGLFISPTVVDRPPDTSDLVKEEPFGKHSRHAKDSSTRASTDISKHPLYPSSPGRMKRRLFPEQMRPIQASEALSGPKTLPGPQELHESYKLERLGSTNMGPSTPACHFQA